MTLRQGDPDLWVGQVWRGAGVGAGYACITGVSGLASREEAINAALERTFNDENARSLISLWQKPTGDDSVEITLTVVARREDPRSWH